MGNTFINYQVKLSPDYSQNKIEELLKKYIEEVRTSKLYYYFDSKNGWLSIYDDLGVLDIVQDSYIQKISAYFESPSLLVADFHGSYFYAALAKNGIILEKMITEEGRPHVEIHDEVWKDCFSDIDMDELKSIFTGKHIDADLISIAFGEILGIDPRCILGYYRSVKEDLVEIDFKCIQQKKTRIPFEKIFRETVLKQIQNNGYVLRDDYGKSPYMLYKETQGITSVISVSTDKGFGKNTHKFDILYISNDILQESFLFTNELLGYNVMYPDSDFENICQNLAKDIHQKLIPRIEKEQEVLFVTHNDLHEIIENRETYIGKYIRVFKNFPTTLEEFSMNLQKLSSSNIKKNVLYMICVSVYTEFLEKTFEGQLKITNNSLWFSSPQHKTVHILSASFAIFANEFYHCFNKGLQIWDISPECTLMLRNGWDKYNNITIRGGTLYDFLSERSY
ncbi:MAG: hypothetical protein LBR25_10155 [Erysipelotrichaceae bacterium]|nr:hypothetical protein [Erysipelotrichaceae bacterium]